jgi:colanic acid/amylovoran biosynthesis glycosyltransferase
VSDHLTMKSARRDVASHPIEARSNSVRLRLAFMTGEYPRATDTFIQREVAALRALNYHVQTFSIRMPPQSEFVDANILAERKSTIYLLPPRGLVIAHLVQILSSPKRYFESLALAWKICPPGIRAIARHAAYFAEAAMLVRLMKKHALRHVHNHFADSSCSVAMIASAMGGTTYSFTIHGPGEFYQPGALRIDEKVKRALFVNCISNFCRSQVMLFTSLDCWNKLRIVHCGVDPEAFEFKKPEGHGNQLLYVGRLAAMKGLPVLLESLAKLEGVTLNVAGDGPDRAVLEEMAQSLNIGPRIKFLGYQSQQQVRKLLMEADLFVMSSFAEGVPVVLMEAMAAGVPVVATRIAGIPELVRDELNGLLVAPGDVNEMTRAIRRLLGNDELRNRVAIAARQEVEREFNIRTEMRWFAKILDSVFCGKNVAIRPTRRPDSFRKRDRNSVL